MVDLKEKLSPNFTLEELLRSSEAERVPELLEEQLNPPADIVDNLRYLCQTTLQPIRDKLGFPIRVTSGYRCEGVNRRVGGSPTSQHRHGQAADLALSPRFLEAGGLASSAPGSSAGPGLAESAAAFAAQGQGTRGDIEERVQTLTGQSIRQDANPNFYLFAFICLHLDELDVDQVIHEYGQGFGRPAWVHVAASRGKDKRQILALGGYVPADKKFPDLVTALRFGI